MENELTNGNLEPDSIFKLPESPDKETFIKTLQDQVYRNAGIPKELLNSLRSAAINNKDTDVTSAVETIKARVHDINKSRQFCLEVKALAAKYGLTFFIAAGTGREEYQPILHIKRFVNALGQYYPNADLITADSDILNELRYDNNESRGNKISSVFFDEFTSEEDIKEILKDSKPHPVNNPLEEHHA